MGVVRYLRTIRKQPSFYQLGAATMNVCADSDG